MHRLTQAIQAKSDSYAADWERHLANGDYDKQAQAWTRCKVYSTAKDVILQAIQRVRWRASTATGGRLAGEDPERGAKQELRVQLVEVLQSLGWKSREAMELQVAMTLLELTGAMKCHTEACRAPRSAIGTPRIHCRPISRHAGVRLMSTPRRPPTSRTREQVTDNTTSPQSWRKSSHVVKPTNNEELNVTSPLVAAREKGSFSPGLPPKLKLPKQHPPRNNNTTVDWGGTFQTEQGRLQGTSVSLPGRPATSRGVPLVRSVRKVRRNSFDTNMRAHDPSVRFCRQAPGSTEWEKVRSERLPLSPRDASWVAARKDNGCWKMRDNASKNQGLRQVLKMSRELDSRSGRCVGRAGPLDDEAFLGSIIG
eukprot:TRINITY_DN33138_c0_g1_i1.p1 TRINITY_DN33138_c0_g1~~TRINITY_DN33138_c0_g1_i1.p1  ORF type:complete len:367 (+),score=58.26 TRINITY_DN33138_c0_g1_i1:228-1328(+)